MKLTITVLSDLHAIGRNSTDGSVSYLRADPTPLEPDLFKDLKATIASKSLSCDLVICPGDICDKGDLNGFRFAWDQLHSLTSDLGAKELIATCGNHDLDSRFTRSEAPEDPDPKGALLQVDPVFPFGDTEDTNHFWARNYVIRQPLPGVTVVVLNTSAYHGGADGELDHGRVSSRTITAILNSLKTKTKTEINILVCHHNLQPLSGYTNTTDGQYAKKGFDLVEALAAQTGSMWLVIHGHRHIPKILVSTAPAYATIGAASFSRVGDLFSNQFHIVELTTDPNSPTVPFGGEINTWNWSRAKKWAQYKDPTKGLPPVCGFGYSGAIPFLATQVLNSIGTLPFMAWVDLQTAVPQLKFLTPEQTAHFMSELEKNGLDVLSNEEGLPKQIGKKK